MRKFPLWTVLGGLALLAPVAHASDSDGQFSVTGGADYSSGTYGTGTSTDIASLPVSARWQDDRWTLKLTVPYVSISGSGNVIPGTGPVANGNPHGRGRGGGGGGTGGASSTRGTASGLGDIVASAGYELLTSADRTAGLDLTGKVKFGTADADQGLGTGQNDYGVAVDAYKVVGAWTAFAGVGWMHYGSSQYIQLDNGFNANVGGSYRFGREELGAYYYYRERIATGGASQSELTAYWNHPLGTQWRLQAYALAGMADGSPDWGGGASLRYSF